MKKPDYISVLSAVIIFVSFLISDFVHIKPTRISSAVSVSAGECLQESYYLFVILLLILILLTAIKCRKSTLNFLTGIYVDFLLAFLVLMIVTVSKENLLINETARLSFGVGQIVAIAGLYSIILKCEEYIQTMWMKVFVSVFGWLLIILFLLNGLLDHYSIMQEYLAAKSQFFNYVTAHLKLTFWAVFVAVVTGIPLGYMCYKSKPFDRVAVIGLSIIEVIPQLALFAVIRIPFIVLSNRVPMLKEMGIGGYGFAPAFTALFLYSLYLMMHNSRAAFSCVDPQLIENAYAMGMDSRTVFFRVQLPAAMPVILNGVRISLMSAIVGASLSSFVGAASLGIYIVNGINALAIDLQLLGVIPIFFMAVMADLGMTLIIKRLTYKRV